MRICVKFHKGGALRYISHLDLQRLMQRAMRRAELPLCYSQGFNPHPIMAFASALSLGYTSDAEWMDVRLNEEVAPEYVLQKLNEALPEGLLALQALAIDESLPTLTAVLQSAAYRVTFHMEEPVRKHALEEGLSGLLSGPIMVEKRTKGGMKTVDMGAKVREAKWSSFSPESGEDALSATLWVKGVLNAAGGLHMELFLQALLGACGTKAHYTVHREAVEFEGIGV